MSDDAKKQLGFSNIIWQIPDQLSAMQDSFEQLGKMLPGEKLSRRLKISQVKRWKVGCLLPENKNPKQQQQASAIAQRPNSTTTAVNEETKRR